MYILSSEDLKWLNRLPELGHANGFGTVADKIKEIQDEAASIASEELDIVRRKKQLTKDYYTLLLTEIQLQWSKDEINKAINDEYK